MTVFCIARVLVSIGGLWLVMGCAAIRVVEADGTEAVSVQPFGAGIVNRHADGPKLISVTAFGMSNTARGVDLGFHTVDIVVPPTKCHAIFVVRSKAQAETASTLAKLVDESCIIQR